MEIVHRASAGFYIAMLHRRCTIRSPITVRDVIEKLILKRNPQWQKINDVRSVRWNDTFSSEISSAHEPIRIIGLPETVLGRFGGWNMSRIAREHTDSRKQVEVRRSSSSKAYTMYGSAPTSPTEDVYKDFRSMVSFAEFADWFESGPTSGTDGLYLANTPLHHIVPDGIGLELPPDVKRKLLPQTPLVYLGKGLQRTPLHFDPTGNLVLVVRGQKTFKLFPPVSSLDLQPLGGILEAILSWYGGWIPAVYSQLTGHEYFLGSVPHINVELKAGEGLWMPSCWWHAVTGSADPNGIIVYGLRNED